MRVHFLDPAELARKLEEKTSRVDECGRARDVEAEFWAVTTQLLSVVQRVNPLRAEDVILHSFPSESPTGRAAGAQHSR